MGYRGWGPSYIDVLGVGAIWAAYPPPPPPPPPPDVFVPFAVLIRNLPSFSAHLWQVRGQRVAVVRVQRVVVEMTPYPQSEGV